MEFERNYEFDILHIYQIVKKYLYNLIKIALQSAFIARLYTKGPLQGCSPLKCNKNQIQKIPQEKIKQLV